MVSAGGGSNPGGLYKCPHCPQWVAYGDRFCRQCGHEYTVEEVAQMKRRDRFDTIRFPLKRVVLFWLLGIICLVMFFSG